MDNNSPEKKIIILRITNELDKEEREKNLENNNFNNNNSSSNNIKK
jgi:hypothetical protein